MMKQRTFGRMSNSAIQAGILFSMSALVSQPAYAHYQQTVIQDQAIAQTRSDSPAKTVLDRRVTVSFKNVSLREALAFVSKEADLKLVYSERLFSLDRKVSLAMANTPVSTVLRELLQGTGVTVRLSEGGRIMLSVENERVQQAGTVTGRVTDSASGKGMAGVTVTVRGANMSKTTNGNGEFTLTGVPAGEQTIEFKLVGYRAFSRTVRVNEGETATVNAVLRAAATMLSEVVTTAIGQQQRKDIGYTVASINVDSVRRLAPIKSMTDLFENRIPGVTVQRSSGTPGDPARIRLRGASSISENNDPVIIVDGARRYSGQSDSRNTVRSGVAGSPTTSGTASRTYTTTSPLDQIDPASIERIDILKGPAAAAMYGPDAASGAIVITTKRGQAGPPQWNVELVAGMSEFPGSWPIGTFQWVTPVLGGLPALCIGFCDQDVIDSVRKFQALNDPYLTPLGRGISFNPTVTLAAGSGNMTYSLTASSLRDRGILKLPKIEEDRYVRYQDRPVPSWMRRPDLLERNSVTGNMQTALNASGTTRLILNTNLMQEVHRRTSMTPIGGGETAISQLQRLWVDRSQLLQTSLIGNPYERVTSPKQTVSNSISITAQPRSWLSAQIIANMNSQTQNSQQVLEAGVMPPDEFDPNFDESGGHFSAQSLASSNSSLTLRLVTPIIRRIRANAGFNYDRERTEDQSGTFKGVLSGVNQPSQPQNQDSSRTTFSRSSTESVFFGYYFSPELVLSDRFNLSPGFRLDQNGLSGNNGKLIGWPSLNGSWLVSEEAFFPWKDLVELRLRGAFGVAGTQPTTGDLNRLYGDFVIDPLTGSEPLYGEMWQVSNLGNTRLRPERVREFDMGFDLSVWNNRISLNFSHSRKFTADAIVSQEIGASVFGNSMSLRTNVGDLQNQTTELTLNATPLERENIGFNFAINFDHRQSLVKRLARNATPTSIAHGVVNYVPGYPLEGLWMKPIRGYNDVDGNGWISVSELVIGQSPIYVGSSEPAYQMSVFPALTLFKNITLAAGIAHVSGQVQQLRINYFGNSDGAISIGSPYEADVVFGPDGFNRQAALLAVSNDKNQTSIGYVQKVDVTRLQYVSITTNVSHRVTRLVRARSMSVSLRGSNLALWTNYIGVDPNVNSSVDTNAGLFDSGQLPQPREWSLNFSLRF